MKRILTLGLAALILGVTPAMAAPDPDPTIDPYTTFLVTRILPNQREVVLGAFEQSTPGTTADAIIRSTALEASRQNRTNNPSWRIVIYGPIDPPATWYTNDDRIWDSATDL